MNLYILFEFPFTSRMIKCRISYFRVTDNTFKMIISECRITFKKKSLADRHVKQSNSTLNVITEPTQTSSKVNLLGKLKFIVLWGFHPIYEIKHHENQWVQLEYSTSRYIEKLYQRGFTRIVIRQDEQLSDIIPERAILIITISQKNGNECMSEKDKAFSIRRTKLLEFKSHSNEKWTLLNDCDTTPTLFKNDPAIQSPLSYTEPPFILNND
ncbi:hypothetical protein K501DRAFT_308110 [Backusella circina FSU 941]|nr:hypothetical protein K501DRAFT_308110 [Backusella circina FSU 941]